MSVHMDCMRTLCTQAWVCIPAIDEIDYAQHIDVHAMITCNNHPGRYTKQSNKIFAHYESPVSNSALTFEQRQ